MRLPTWDELQSLTTDELKELNLMIVGIVNERRADRQLQASREFKIGDIAGFIYRKTGEEVFFRVERINGLTLSGHQVDLFGHAKRGTARAAPTLCRKVDLAAERRPVAPDPQPLSEPKPATPVRRRMRLPS